MESESQLAAQKIENLEMILKEKEDRIHDEFEGKINNLNSQVENINKEKIELEDKITTLQQQISAKDRELTTAKTRLESFEEEVQRKISDVSG